VSKLFWCATLTACFALAALSVYKIWPSCILVHRNFKHACFFSCMANKFLYPTHITLSSAYFLFSYQDINWQLFLRSISTSFTLLLHYHLLWVHVIFTFLFISIFNRVLI
jgi:hypothetical protein